MGSTFFSQFSQSSPSRPFTALTFLPPPEYFPPRPLSLPHPGIILLSPHRQQVKDKVTGTWRSEPAIMRTSLPGKPSAQTLNRCQNLG